MPKAALKKGDAHLIFCLIATVVLMLALFNFNKYFEEQKVLGIKIEVDQQSEEQLKEREFWESFLAENPNYIPGWIELGDFEKVKQIDPNYFLGL